MTPPLLLALETSCDETSAAVLRGESELLGHVIFTQDIHRLYGGVVPELASRAHLRTVDDVVDGALREAGVGLDEVDAFAVTAGPGRELWEVALRPPTLVLPVRDVGAARNFAVEASMVEMPERSRVVATDVRPAVVRLDLQPAAARSR